MLLCQINHFYLMIKGASCGSVVSLLYCVKHDAEHFSFTRWGNSCDSVWKVKQTFTGVHSDRPVWKRTEIVRPSPHSFVIIFNIYALDTLVFEQFHTSITMFVFTAALCGLGKISSCSQKRATRWLAFSCRGLSTKRRDWMRSESSTSYWIPIVSD